MNSPSVCHVTRGQPFGFVRSISASIASSCGPGECPSPVTSVVTPWRILPSSFGSISTAACELPRRSMKPGAMTWLVASSVVVAVACERSPMAAMVSPRMPRSARVRAAPVPSMSMPLRMRMSKVGDDA
jgi:hypothetical protein